MTVYLLHFSEPYAHCAHYIGWCADEKDPRDRLQEHLDGMGNGLVREASRAGIDITVARVWPNATRGFERWLKRLKGVGKRACPTCLGRTPRGRTAGYEPEPKSTCLKCGAPAASNLYCKEHWDQFRQSKT